MKNSKTTSPKAASAASKVLRDGRTSKTSKTAAGSALSQAPSRKKQGVQLMPQPATHYLIARGSIPEDHHKTWWDIYKPEFALGSSAPDLFYFPTIGKFMPQGVSVAADTP